MCRCLLFITFRKLRVEYFVQFEVVVIMYIGHNDRLEQNYGERRNAMLRSGKCSTINAQFQITMRQLLSVLEIRPVTFSIERCTLRIELYAPTQQPLNFLAIKFIADITAVINPAKLNMLKYIERSIHRFADGIAI